MRPMPLVLALLGALRAALRTRTDLTLENLALRQQLALLRRRSKRPQFGRLDRLLWVWLSNHWAGWREALHLVRPESVIRWHRQGFRAFWTWKSRRGRPGRPPVSSELAQVPESEVGDPSGAVTDGSRAHDGLACHASTTFNLAAARRTMEENFGLPINADQVV